MPSFVIAGSATISWQANTESDLQEYRVYTGTASRTYGTPVSVGKVTSYTVNNLQEDVTYFFAVTSVDTSDNESGFSQEVSKTIPDTNAPTLALTSPTTGTTYETPQGTLDLRGTAADNVGVRSVGVIPEEAAALRTVQPPGRFQELPWPKAKTSSQSPPGTRPETKERTLSR